MEHATLTNVSKFPNPPPVSVQFNPGEYTIERGARYADLPVPGLAVPILQFVRGEAQTLSLELFLDGTERRADAPEKETVEGRLDALRELVTIDGELHAPPVCRFAWRKVTFQGVVTQLKEHYQLFDADGQVLRARVNLVFRSYQPVEVQLRAMNLLSPDRTHVRVLREGETLAQLAAEAYGDPRLWRAIAEANGIDRPRFVAPGTPLRIPAL